MRRKKGNSFAKIGTICVVLIVALCLTGVGYGLWSEALNVNTIVKTGIWGEQVSCGQCFSSGTPDQGSISCSKVVFNELELTVTNAHYSPIYTCWFNIANPGTIPLKIQEIIKTGVPTGVAASVQLVQPGDQIEPGGTLAGVVRVQLDPKTPENPNMGDTFSFNVEFTLVKWNQYVPPPP